MLRGTLKKAPSVYHVLLEPTILETITMIGHASPVLKAGPPNPQARDTIITVTKVRKKFLSNQQDNWWLIEISYWFTDSFEFRSRSNCYKFRSRSNFHKFRSSSNFSEFATSNFLSLCLHLIFMSLVLEKYLFFLSLNRDQIFMSLDLDLKLTFPCLALDLFQIFRASCNLMSSI